MDSLTSKKRKAEITILDATSTAKTSQSSPSPKSRRVRSTGDINDNASTNDSNNNSEKVSPSKSRLQHGQDLSHLQRPSFQVTDHPKQPPLNPKFERPYTRSSSLLDHSPDSSKPQENVAALKSTRKKHRHVEESGVPASSQSSKIASSSKSSKRTSGEDRRQSTDEPEGISAIAPTTAPQESPNNNVQESHSTPSNAVSHKPLAATDVPVSIPAQIAVVEASPSKRVAFSPYRQKSPLSIPSAASTPKLKGILKSPAPTRVLNRDHELDSTEMRNPFVVTTESDYSERKSFVKEALESLQSEDAQIRSSAYLNLQAKFREGDENPFYLKEVKESMRLFARYLMRDLDLNSPPSLIQATLKCTGYFLFNQRIVAMFTSKEIEALLIQILHLVNAADEKPTCNLAIWTLSSTRIPPRLLYPFLPQMIEAFLDNLESRFKSSSITSESLGGMFSVFTQFPNEIVATVQSWLIPVLTRLISPIPGIRSRALELLTMAIPKLIEKEDPRRIQAVNEFMDDYSTEFLEVLTANFLDANDEVYAVTVWGALVTLMGKKLQKSPLLNPMLKMVEKCFNSTSSARTEIKMAAFQAWTRLIYNFAIGGHIANEKPLKLMLTPFANCLFNERHKRIRLACFNAWISLIYALGSRLSKHADQVLFPQLKLAIVDESEHVRDLALRLIVALISNSGGQDLVEGRQSIVPGSITFSDLGCAEASWVRTDLLDICLDCVYQTVGLQHRIQEAAREDWKVLGLTELPLLTQRCATTWETIVRAIRDINLQEKGMSATSEADRALSSLLFFVEKLSRCNPKALIPGEWPNCDPEKLALLKHDTESTGYIIRADIIHYFLTCVIEIFSPRTLMSARYQVRDKIHDDIYNAIYPVSEPTSQTSDVAPLPQDEGLRSGVILSPLEFILKSWLATGESVIGTALEDPFWQAISAFVEFSTKGINALGPLYRCLDHIEDIRMKRHTTNTSIWPEYSNDPITPTAFRVFQCKFWAIVSQKLRATISRTNQIIDGTVTGYEQAYVSFIKFMMYPFMILSDPNDIKRDIPDMDYSQRMLDSQDPVITQMVQFMETFKAISLPTWTELLQIFYRTAQHKRSHGNDVMNTLAAQIRELYGRRQPFVWIQSFSVACTSNIVDTLVLHGFKGPSAQKSSVPTSRNTTRGHRIKENFDDLLNLCSDLFAEAYDNVRYRAELITSEGIPQIQEAAFLLMERTINKAPSSQIIQWLQVLQPSIITWFDDPMMNIRNLSKMQRRPYRARIETMWTRCILEKLLKCSPSSIGVGGPNSAFGSVLPAPLTTIRGIYQHMQQKWQKASSASNPANPVLDTKHAAKDVDSTSGPFNSETLAQLSPLLFAALNSHHKSIVNKTLEFWNQTFGKSNTDLNYPEDIALIMQQLKLVATISLPGWKFGDNSQTEVPQFASLSQEMLSLPQELHVRSESGLSRLLKEKAAVARQLSRKKNKQTQGVGVGDAATLTGLQDGANISSSSNNTSGAATPSSLSTPIGSRPQTPLIHTDSSVQQLDVNSDNNNIDPDIGASPTRKSDKGKEIWVANPHKANPDPKLMNEPDSAENSMDEVEVFSPSKRAQKALAMKETQLRPPSTKNSLSKPANTTTTKINDTHIKVNETNRVMDLSTPASTSASALASVSGPSSVYFSAGSSPRDNNSKGNEEVVTPTPSEGSSPSATASIQRDNAEIRTMEDRRIRIEAPGNVNGGAEIPKLIETAEEFLKTVQHLGEARNVVNQMDTRQLFELQRQLMVLNQAAHDALSQSMMKDARK